MPSIARKHQLQGSLLYHVINRGNRREDVFHMPQDYQYFIDLLSGYLTKFEAVVYHWVLMPNHYHLLLEIKVPENLSVMMAGFARSYVYYYQRKYNIGGHIWQGRFKSQPIEKEKYLLSCGRYIERNPVKAKMVNTAEDYEYSSARFYCLGNSDKLTAEDPCFETFGSDISERRKEYSKYLKTYEDQDELIFHDNEDPIGSPLFKAKLDFKQSRYMPKHKGKPREPVILSL